MVLKLKRNKISLYLIGSKDKSIWYPGCDFVVEKMHAKVAKLTMFEF